MGRQARRKPPRRNRAPHLSHFPPLVEVNQVNRKLHEKSMDRLAGQDPKPLARFQAVVFEKPGPPLGARIRYFGGLRQNCPAGLIPHLYVQLQNYNTSASEELQP